MIYEVEGDVLLSDCQVIAHGVAPSDHFDSGLALALRERWPSMTKDFRHYCHDRHSQAGEIWLWGGPDARRGSVQIANLMTQDASEGAGGRPGKARLENVRHCLKALAHLAEKEGFKSIALPRLATGVGGLDWAEVKPLIAQYLGELKIPVVVYTTFHAGQKAKEPALVTA